MGSSVSPLELVVEVAVLTIRQGRLSVVATRREELDRTLPSQLRHPDSRCSDPTGKSDWEHLSHRGAWSLLSAPLQSGEDTDAVAERVLRTHAGAHSGRDTMFVEQLRTYSAPGRVPHRRVASVAYVALIADVGFKFGELSAVDTWVFAVDDLGITVGDGSGFAADTPSTPNSSGSSGTSSTTGSSRTPGLSGLSGPSGQALGQPVPDEPGRVLAFDHDVILVDAIERVRAKFEYTTVATSLVTEPFTVPELRRVYESVWGVSLHPANFRRKVLATPGFVLSSAPGPVDGVDGSERRGPELFRRGTAALLHPAMLRPFPTDE